MVHGDLKWSKSEKASARYLFDLACQRDYERLMARVKEFPLEEYDDLWKLREFLNMQAKAFDEKYDYRYSMLPLLLARYVNEGLLNREELDRLGDEKKEEIEEILQLSQKFKNSGEEI
ncbi:MAG: hypothetical protein PHO65_01425 [Sulfurovum sp.]|nr:hypothetical protein [Sulfurovum sp.]